MKNYIKSLFILLQLGTSFGTAATDGRPLEDWEKEVAKIRGIPLESYHTVYANLEGDEKFEWDLLVEQKRRAWHASFANSALDSELSPPACSSSSSS